MQGAAATLPSSTAKAAEKEQYAKPDRTIKGPALASRSHSIQILVMLGLNSFLLFMCLYVLPAHLLWRQALKNHSVLQQDIQDGITNSTTANGILADSVAAADANSTSATRNLFTAFRILFKIPYKDALAVAGIQKAFRSSLAAVLLSQGWFVARYKGWWEEAEAMERGDRDEVLKRRKIGIGMRMEDVTMTSFALPIPVIAVYLILVLCGAPIMSNHLDTLIASTYLSVFIFFSSFTLLGADESEWSRAFSLSSSIKSTPRFKLLASQVSCTILGGLIGSAGHLLDWERAWQVYPVPTILGSCLGLIVGNGVGFVAYYSAVSSGLRRVELRAKSAVSTNKNSSKKKKKR